MAAPGYAEGVEGLVRERSTVGRTLHGKRTGGRVDEGGRAGEGFEKH
jgi:hypothetical protein